MSEHAPFRLEQFQDYLTYERGLSPRTVSAYGRDLGRWLAFVAGLGVRDPGRVTAQQLREWVFSLKDAGLSATSIRRAQSALRTYYAFLLAEGAVAADPTDRLESPRAARKLPDFLSLEETRRLLEAPAQDKPLYWRDRAILEVLYASGVRVSELVDLPLSALDVDEGFATVLGKGAKERIVPVGRAALDALRDWMAARKAIAAPGEAAMFVARTGRRLSPRSIEQRLAAWAVKQGLGRHVHPHMLRHSFASHLLQSSGDLRAVQELLGHASIASTQVYTHLDFQALAKVYDAAHPRAKKKDRQSTKRTTPGK
jgi:integrase/recombinase XerC